MRTWWRSRRKGGPARSRKERSGPQSRPLSCQELVELVTDYLDGALDAETVARFDEHIAGCDGCATYVEQIRQTARLVGKLDERHLSAPARSRLLEAFRDWKRTTQ